MLNKIIRKKLIKLYLRGESSRNLAKQFNVSYSTVLRVLKSENLVLRRPGLASKLTKELRDRVIEDSFSLNVEALCEKYGLHSRTVYRILKSVSVKSDLGLKSVVIGGERSVEECMHGGELK